MKFLYWTGTVLWIGCAAGVWIEAVWLLGGSDPVISTSVDVRAYIVIATGCVALAGAYGRDCAPK